MSSISLLLLWLVIAGIGLVWLLRRWRKRRAEALLRRWADAQGLQLIAFHPVDWSSTSFQLSRSDARAAFEVTIQNSEGHVARGRVQCGNSFFGLLSSAVQFTWEFESKDSRGFPVVLRETPPQCPKNESGKESERQ